MTTVRSDCSVSAHLFSALTFSTATTVASIVGSDSRWVALRLDEGSPESTSLLKDGGITADFGKRKRDNPGISLGGKKQRLL